LESRRRCRGLEDAHDPNARGDVSHGPAKTLSRPGVEQMDAIASSTEPRIVADTRESAGEPSAIAGTANRTKALSTIASSSYSPQSDAARLATVRREGDATPENRLEVECQ
jgi:hypothetical protein